MRELYGSLTFPTPLCILLTWRCILSIPSGWNSSLMTSDVTSKAFGSSPGGNTPSIFSILSYNVHNNTHKKIRLSSRCILPELQISLLHAFVCFAGRRVFGRTYVVDCDHMWFGNKGHRIFAIMSHSNVNETEALSDSGAWAASKTFPKTGLKLVNSQENFSIFFKTFNFLKILYFFKLRFGGCYENLRFLLLDVNL